MYKKRLAALLLSLCLTIGAAAPSFAEPSLREQNESTAQTEQTDSQTQDNEQTADSADTQDSSTADTQNNSADNSTAADGTESSDNTDTSDASNDAVPISDESASKPVDTTEEDTPLTEMPNYNVNAKASILVNGETGEIVQQQNAHDKMYPASCTKILTALLTLENCKLDDSVTMAEEDFADVNNGASNAGFKVGEVVTVESLLYGLLLPSGNEAANALARTVSGSVEDFAKLMNKRAKELGCTDSHFVNPNGLHNDDHYTSAYDLYLIAREAMTHEEFQTIVNTAQKTLPATNMNAERKIYTTNQLILSKSTPIYYAPCYGIKTGHTSQAGYCLVSYATQNDYTYYSVVLGAEMGTEYAGSFTETRDLFSWAFDTFRLKTATKAGAAVTEGKVRLGRGSDHVTLVTAQDIPILIPANADTDALETSIQIEDSYDAPIAKGDKLGTVTYSFGGTECATADLVALTDIERSPVLYVFDQIGKFLSLTPVRILLGILIAAFIVYLVLSVIAGRNRKKRERRKQRRLRKNNKNK